MNLQQAMEEASRLFRSEAEDPDYVYECRACLQPYLCSFIASPFCPDCMLAAMAGKDRAGWPLRDGP